MHVDQVFAVDFVDLQHGAVVLVYPGQRCAAGQHARDDEIGIAVVVVVGPGQGGVADPLERGRVGAIKLQQVEGEEAVAVGLLIAVEPQTLLILDIPADDREVEVAVVVVVGPGQVAVVGAD